jgi:hypothetical protein
LSQHQHAGAVKAWLVAVACFTALALLFTSQVWIDYAYAGRPLSWPRAFLVALVDWELWALATPLVAWLCARFPFSRARWGVPLAVHVPAGIALGGLKLFLDAMLTALIVGTGRPGPFSFLKIHLTQLTYWGIVAAIHVIRYYRVARARASLLSPREARRHQRIAVRRRDSALLRVPRGSVPRRRRRFRTGVAFPSPAI